MKPTIRRDLYTPHGYTCRSVEPGGFTGKHSVIAFGDTIPQAYANWEQQRETKRQRYEEQP